MGSKLFAEAQDVADGGAGLADDRIGRQAFEAEDVGKAVGDGFAEGETVAPVETDGAGVVIGGVQTGAGEPVIPGVPQGGVQQGAPGACPFWCGNERENFAGSGGVMPEDQAAVALRR